jgi:hypothetical protein
VGAYRQKPSSGGDFRGDEVNEAVQALLAQPWEDATGLAAQLHGQSTGGAAFSALVDVHLRRVELRDGSTYQTH